LAARISAETGVPSVQGSRSKGALIASCDQAAAPKKAIVATTVAAVASPAFMEGYPVVEYDKFRP
jgi:hypothetical protein